MDIVQMIIIAILIAIYPRKGTFVANFKFKMSLKGIECNISTKEKNCPPAKKDSSNQKH